jgi:hypothetical protein
MKMRVRERKGEKGLWEKDWAAGNRALMVWDG